MTKNIYWSEGVKRRQAIAEWTEQEIIEDGKHSRLMFIGQLAFENDFVRAMREFKQLIASLRNETILYLVDKSFDRFGEVVWFDLFNRVIRPKRRASRKKIEDSVDLKPMRVEELRKDVKNIEPVKKRIFGFNSKGEREEARIEVSRSKDKSKNIIKLKSIETGKILTETNKFKELKK